MKIEAADLRKVVDEMLEDYAKDVDEAVGVAVEKTAAKAVRELKSAEAGFRDREYSKGWTKKVMRHRLYSEATVYNRTHGQLTHLLEFGHALRNGGRARAFPHIAPVNDEVPNLFTEEFEKLL